MENKEAYTVDEKTSEILDQILVTLRTEFGPALTDKALDLLEKNQVPIGYLPPLIVEIFATMAAMAVDSYARADGNNTQKSVDYFMRVFTGTLNTISTQPPIEEAN